jgi:hypothetical protein
VHISRAGRWFACFVVVLVCAACVQTTAPTDTGGGITLSSSSGKPIRLSYVNDLQPVFASDCVRCHSGSSASAGYSMTDYASVMTAVRTGDASSPLIVETQPLGHMFTYFSGDALRKSSLVYLWIVEYDAENLSSEGN